MKNLLKTCSLAALALAAALGVSQKAHAGQILTLDYRDMEVTDGTILQLKQDLMNAYPRLPVEDMDVISVQVETKLQDYSGDVSARVGGYISERRSIYGNPRDFYNPAPGTFTNLYFSLPMGGYESRGPWQLIFNGSRFKIRHVSIELEQRYYPGPGRPYPPQPPPGRPGRPGRPYPPQPPGRPYPPPPTQRYTEVDCSNWDSRPTFCRVGFQIQQVRVMQLYSHTQCIEGQSFFIEGDGLRVTNGCRARFSVTGY